MRIALACFLLLHGIAHIVGFLGAWAPTRTTIIGDRIDLGIGWIKLVGVAWLVLAVAFAAVALATVIGVAGWPTIAITIASASLMLCLLQLPETQFGVGLNVVLIAGVIFGQHRGWL
jgi:hypothetical protein